jgi:hypothetical protein
MAITVTRASLAASVWTFRVARAELVASASGDTVNAGADQAVDATSTVTVTATASGAVTWSQVSGPVVTLTPAGLSASFIAPAALAGASVVLRATCGAATDDVTVTVQPHAEWWSDGAAWSPLVLHVL